LLFVCFCCSSKVLQSYAQGLNLIVGKRYTWEAVNILIRNTAANNAENNLLQTFRPSTGAIVNAKANIAS